MADPKVTVRILADGSQARGELKQVEGSFAKLSSFIRTKGLAIAAALGTVAAAFRQLRQATDLQGQTEALKQNLNSQGIAIDGYIAKLKEASNAQVSTAELTASAGRAILLGIPADQITELLEVARVRAIALGVDVGKAFQDLTTGLARRSIPILDNLGFTLANLTKAQDEYAESLGTTTEELSDSERAHALLQGVLEQGRKDAELFADSQDKISEAIAQTTAKIKDLANLGRELFRVFSGGILTVFGRTVQGLIPLLGVLNELLAKIFTTLGKGLSFLPIVGSALKGIGAGLRDINKDLLESQGEWQRWADDLSAATDKARDIVLGLRTMSENLVTTKDDVEDQGGALEDYGVVLDDTGESLLSFVTRQKALRNELVETSRQLIITSGDFTRYERQFGRGAANEQALEDGASIQGGRLRLAGGATRLLRDEQGLFPGISGGSYSYTTRRSSTDPDGRIVFNATRSRFRL